MMMMMMMNDDKRLRFGMGLKWCARKCKILEDFQFNSDNCICILNETLSGTFANFRIYFCWVNAADTAAVYIHTCMSVLCVCDGHWLRHMHSCKQCWFNWAIFATSISSCKLHLWKGHTRPTANRNAKSAVNDGYNSNLTQKENYKWNNAKIRQIRCK